jgi:hypothetical protein
MTRNLLAIVVLLLSQFCTAQSTMVTSSKYFGGTAADMGQFVHLANDGNLIVIGMTRSFDGNIVGQHGGSDIWVAKISQQGTILWQRTLGGGDEDVAVSYAYDAASGSVTVVGNTYSANGDVTVSRGMGDVWAVRIDALGALMWQRTLGGSDIDRALKLINTSDGNVLVCAETQSTNGDVTGSHGGAEIWLVKLNGGNGTVLWKRCYGSTGNEYGNYISTALLEPIPGQYLFTANAGAANGDVGGFNGGSSDAWVVSVNAANGSIFWQTCLGGSGVDMVRNLKPTPNGNWLVLVQAASAGLTGYHAGTGGAADNFDVLHCRLSNTGTLLTTKCYGSRLNEVPVDLLVLNDSTDMILASVQGNGGDISGGTANIDEFSKNLWLCKVKNDTGIVWQKSLGGSRDEHHSLMLAYNVVSSGDLRSLPNNALLLTCLSRSNDGNVARNHPYGPFTDYDIWMLALDSVGNITSQQTLGGGRNEWPGGPLATMGTNSFYLTGSTQSINNNSAGSSHLTDLLLYRINGGNHITGKVFWDVDSNGVQNGSEPLINDGYITISKPGFSQNAIIANGRYLLPLDTGIYQLNSIPPQGYYQPVPLNDTMLGYFEHDVMDIALRRRDTLRNVAVAIVPLGQLWPDSTANYLLRYSNLGTDTVANGWVVFKKEPRTTVQLATPAVDSTAGDSLIWRYAQLRPFEQRTIRLALHTADTPVIAPWDTLYQVAAITPVVGDTNRLNNFDTLYQVADTGSLVRIKTASQGRWLNLNQAQAGGWLQYTIHYTHTGPGLLDSLLVTDTLDALLDSASYQLVYTSHPAQLQPATSRQLSWAFNGIALLPGQSCTISFRVRPRGTVALGNVVQNKAWIWRRPGVLLQETEQTATELR